MSQPVKLSDGLVLDARITAQLAERSIAGQIEFWARLGRAVEPMLRGDKSLALRKAGDEVPLSELLEGIDRPAGQRRLAEYIKSRPFPHYAPSPDQPGLLIRTEEDGTETIGRFINREFVAAGRSQPKGARARTTQRPSATGADPKPKRKRKR